METWKSPITRISEGICFEGSRRYVAIKLQWQLIKEGSSVSLKRVQQLMELGCLTSII